MSAVSCAERLWAVVLAGGEGTRLAALTRHITGRDCPKQFCPVAGGRSLLGQTLARIAPLVPAERTVVIGCRAQAEDLRRELPDLLPHVLMQPVGRGTAPAILWPTHWVAARDPEATVVVLPSDHFVHQERTFRAHVARAVAIVDEHPRLVVLLGVSPDMPDAAYGWIEPGEALPGGAGCYRVRRFREKPPPEQAAAFFEAGFLWNTLILVARATALISLFHRHLPDLDARLARLGLVAMSDDPAVQEAYRDLRPVNFSQAVLERGDPDLAVLPVHGMLWSDWGTPERVVRTLVRVGGAPPWLESWLAREAVGDPDLPGNIVAAPAISLSAGS